MYLDFSFAVVLPASLGQRCHKLIPSSITETGAKMKLAIIMIYRIVDFDLGSGFENTELLFFDEISEFIELISILIDSGGDELPAWCNWLDSVISFMALVSAFIV